MDYKKIRWGAVVSTFFLIAVFLGLGQTQPGLDIAFVPNWTNSSPGELYTWLGVLCLLMPAAGLFCWGLYPAVRQSILLLEESLEKATTKDMRMFAAVGTIAYLACCWLVHQYAFRSLPFTDDEYAVRFGGQLLASGRVSIPLPEYWEAMPKAFLFSRDGYVTSFDFLGALLPWAFSEITNTGSLIFHLCSAGTALFVCLTVYRLLGRKWAMICGCLFVLSPMTTLISGTMHTQLVSRFWVALTLYLAIVLVQREKRSTGVWLGYGLCVGMGFLTRPFEVGALLLPITLWLLWKEYKKSLGYFPKAIVGLVLGGLGPLVAFCAHNYVVTGTWYLPARMAPNELTGTAIVAQDSPIAFLQDTTIFWKRFGSNLGYNLFMLSIWFLGPVGFVVALFGVTRSTLSRCLGVGIGLCLLLGLLHDDYGLHVVGPIHYSETSIPLFLLCCLGLQRMAEHGRSYRISPRIIVGLLLSMCLGLCGLTIRQSAALRRQALVHQTVYQIMDQPEYADSVMLVPDLPRLWPLLPQARLGSWVFHWRRPHPAQKESVTILYYQRDTLPSIKKHFANRPIFQLTVDKNGMTIRPLSNHPNNSNGG